MSAASCACSPTCRSTRSRGWRRSAAPRSTRRRRSWRPRRRRSRMAREAARAAAETARLAFEEGRGRRHAAEHHPAGGGAAGRHSGFRHSGGGRPGRDQRRGAAADPRRRRAAERRAVHRRGADRVARRSARRRDEALRRAQAAPAGACRRLMMTQEEITAWALQNGWQMIAGHLSLTKPRAHKEAIVRLVLKATVANLEVKKLGRQQMGEDRGRALLRDRARQRGRAAARAWASRAFRVSRCSCRRTRMRRHFRSLARAVGSQTSNSPP